MKPENGAIHPVKTCASVSTERHATRILESVYVRQDSKETSVR